MGQVMLNLFTQQAYTIREWAFNLMSVAVNLKGWILKGFLSFYVKFELTENFTTELLVMRHL